MVIALGLIFDHLNLPAFRRAVRGMHVGWFLAALGIYGFLFLPAALRWHLVLRLSGCAEKFRVTASFTLLGHFLYTLFFGAIGGDSAKAFWYAEWKKHDLSKVLASAPLDRLLGFGGLIVLGIIAVSIAAITGDHTLSQMPLWRRSPVPLLVAAGLIAAGIVAARRSGRSSLFGRFAIAFKTSLQALLRKPETALLGIACGFLVQLSLCATLAFNLRAVTSGDLPWAKLAWTFPLVVIVSGLPLTTAGLGAREGAALILLTVYAVSREQAVAASLLTAGVSIIWAIIGGAVFLYERSAARARAEAEARQKCTGEDGLSLLAMERHPGWET
jgi:uncharacterized membrane protein YbhN (UPF0104 family)